MKLENNMDLLFCLSMTILRINFLKLVRDYANSIGDGGKFLLPRVSPKGGSSS